MYKLEITEKYRAETREEAEDFIRMQREDGKNQGYTVSKASYAHKEKKAKGEIIDKCEVVLITKVFCDLWGMENEE